MKNSRQAIRRGPVVADRDATRLPSHVRAGEHISRSDPVWRLPLLEESTASSPSLDGAPEPEQVSLSRSGRRPAPDAMDRRRPRRRAGVAGWSWWSSSCVIVSRHITHSFGAGKARHYGLIVEDRPLVGSRRGPRGVRAGSARTTALRVRPGLDRRRRRSTSRMSVERSTERADARRSRLMTPILRRPRSTSLT